MFGKNGVGESLPEDQHTLTIWTSRALREHANILTSTPYSPSAGIGTSCLSVSPDVPVKLSMIHFEFVVGRLDMFRRSTEDGKKVQTRYERSLSSKSCPCLAIFESRTISEAPIKGSTCLRHG